MRDPFDHHFLGRQDTMYLSTINKQDFKVNRPYFRESSFLKNDIAGSKPKHLVSKHARETNFSLSTYVQPVPERARTINKTSNPLLIDDIQGARPKVTEFISKRVVNPLCPKYILPSASEMSVEEGRKFIRDTLNVKDINGKKSHDWIKQAKGHAKQQIEGSQPSRLTKYMRAKSRLEVKDINKDGVFQSKRLANPLEPVYNWRDNDQKQLSHSYGFIEGSRPMNLIKQALNRPANLCLDTKDIEGTAANSLNAKAHFIDKRRQFKNYMAIQDIEKACASSLKKGITTSRQTNPLMPRYNFPGSKEISK